MDMRGLGWLGRPSRLDMPIVRADQRAGFANPSTDTLESFGVTPTHSGQRVTVQSMLQEAGVYSAVRMISEAIGMCPLKVYRITPDSDEREEARLHRSWRLLHDKPNDHCNAHEFWAAVAVHLLAYENALIGKNRGPTIDGVSFVESLELLDPQKYTMEWNATGQKVFIHTESGQRFGQDQILHIPGFSVGGYVGKSRAELCRQTLGNALGRSKFEGTFWNRGARLPGVIQHPGRLGPKGMESLSRGLSMWHEGVDNMHRFPVLEEGATINWAGMSMEDMQFVELRQQTLSEIAVMFQLPPAYLGASTGDSLTYATTESNQIQFATMAVAPLSARIDSAVSNDPELLPQNIMFAQRRLEELYRADMKTRAEYWATMKTVLNLKPEYIASRENIPHSAIGEPPKPEIVLPSESVADNQEQNGNTSNGNGAGPLAAAGTPARRVP